MTLLACVVLLLIATQPVEPGAMATPPGWLAETGRAEALIERGQPLDAGRSDLLPEALDLARRAIPRTAPLRREAAMFVLDVVATRENLPRDEVRRVVAEARALVDDALVVDPSFTEGLTMKASVLLLEAERLEQDPARKAVLQAEADALYQQAFASPRP